MKKYLLGLFAITFAIASVAFTNVKKANTTKKFSTTFHFTGSVESAANYGNSSNWEIASGSDCGGSGVVCRIVSDDYSTTSALASAIAGDTDPVAFTRNLASQFKP